MDIEEDEYDSSYVPFATPDSSPGESASSVETRCRRLAEHANHGERVGDRLVFANNPIALQLSHLDFPKSVFPPTPARSPTLILNQHQDILCDVNITGVLAEHSSPINLLNDSSGSLLMSPTSQLTYPASSQYISPDYQQTSFVGFQQTLPVVQQTSPVDYQLTSLMSPQLTSYTDSHHTSTVDSHLTSPAMSPKKSVTVSKLTASAASFQQSSPREFQLSPSPASWQSPLPEAITDTVPLRTSNLDVLQQETQRMKTVQNAAESFVNRRLTEMLTTEAAIKHLPVIQCVRDKAPANDIPVYEHDKADNTTAEESVTSSDSTVMVRGEKHSGIKSNSKAKRLLAFPPCAICSGTATGSHYGEITCEACKGFFRRYLQKKEEYKCTKGGNCEIINRNRGNCAGCRLKKCLALHMSKDKSKYGRYTLTHRTETIKKMNKFNGMEVTESATGGNEKDLEINENKTISYDLESEMIGRKIIKNAQNLNVSNGFSSALVSELVKAMEDIQPFGPNIKTTEQIMERHRYHAERYRRKTELFGRMNRIPKDEYYRLYKDFGIDIDGRMEELKLCCKDVEGSVERYCNFAKHIPGFYRLPYRDQSNLLKSSRADFFTIIMNKAYSKEHETFLDINGYGYHIDEVVDKFISRKLTLMMAESYCRWQMLEMSKEETAVIAALTLVFTDRCKLENHAEVEKIQFALTDIIQMELSKTDKANAQRRFTKIIDVLTLMRGTSELYLHEYNLMCQDDVLVEEVPMLTEFLLEDDNIVAHQ